ncbi:hypothetical protein [Streptomyces sp. YIM S03343]
MNIERGPRKERNFVIVDNTLAQNNDLSLGARGMAIYILSLPPGAKVDIRSLAEQAPDGRQAIAGFMNELEAARYLVRTTVRAERGRFRTTCTLYEEPQAEDDIPVSVAKPWTHANTRKKTAESASSQVGPNPASPDFGGPDAGGPDFGSAGSTPYGGKELGERTSPQPPADEPATPPSLPHQGGGGDASHEEQRAASFVDSLPYAGRLPGRKTRDTLIARTSDALRAGWTETALHRHLTTGTAGAKSLPHVYGYRLDPEQLPDPQAAAAAVAADGTYTPPTYRAPAALDAMPPNEALAAARAAIRARRDENARGRDRRPWVPNP